MKNVFKTSLFLLAVLVSFSSCKKEELSLLNPELSLSGYNSEQLILNYYQSQLNISGKIAPEDALNEKVTIKVTSDADPTGFEFTADLTDGEVVDGKIKYLYKSFNSTVYASNETDATLKRIKVGQSAGKVTITVGDNLISKSFNVSSDEILALTYWPSDNSAYLQLYGYSFNGTETKQIIGWTTRDDQEIPFDLTYNSNESQNAFSQYTFDIDYFDGWSDYANATLGIYPEGDTIFLKYNGKTYYSVLKENTSAPLLEY